MAAPLALLVLAAATCPQGQLIGPDTQGHCCWPDQVWSASRNLCVGVPACPAPLRPQGETCALVCPAGQSVTPDTAGNCCWPQQVWAPSQRRCVGTPQCPAGMAARGESCVEAEAAVPAASPAPPAVSAPAAPPAAPSAAEAPPAPSEAPAPRTHTEWRARKGLVITGAALLGAGYLIALATAIGGAAWAAAFPENTCWRFVSNVAWIPIIGPAISVLGQQGLYRGSRGDRPCTGEVVYPFGVALAVIDTALQVSGLALLLVGIAARQAVEVPDEPEVSHRTGLGVHPFVSIGAPGSSVGLTAGLRW